jgi:hypothetical protein
MKAKGDPTMKKAISNAVENMRWSVSHMEDAENAANGAMQKRVNELTEKAVELLQEIEELEALLRHAE